MQNKTLKSGSIFFTSLGGIKFTSHVRQLVHFFDQEGRPHIFPIQDTYINITDPATNLLKSIPLKGPHHYTKYLGTHRNLLMEDKRHVQELENKSEIIAIQMQNVTLLPHEAY